MCKDIFYPICCSKNFIVTKDYTSFSPVRFDAFATNCLKFKKKKSNIDKDIDGGKK